MAVAGFDGSITLIDLVERKPLYSVQGHPSAVWGLSFSRDGQQLASGGDDGTVRLWNSATGEALRTLQGHQSAIWGLSFSRDGQQLASSGNDGTLRLWNPHLGTWVLTLLPLAEGWVAISADRRYKTDGTFEGGFWFAAALCRFEPGELDPYVPLIRRLPKDAPLFPALG